MSKENLRASEVCRVLLEQSEKCQTACGCGLLLAIKGHLEGRTIYEGCTELWQVADMLPLKLQEEAVEELKRETRVTREFLRIQARNRELEEVVEGLLKTNSRLKEEIGVLQADNVLLKEENGRARQAIVDAPGMFEENKRLKEEAENRQLALEVRHGQLVALNRSNEEQQEVLDSRGEEIEGLLEADTAYAEKNKVLQEEIESLKRTITNHNEKMKKIPTLKTQPEMVEGLRFLADWFEAVYAGHDNTSVQDDLRKWASEIVNLRGENHFLRNEKAAQGVLIEALKKNNEEICIQNRELQKRYNDSCLDCTGLRKGHEELNCRVRELKYAYDAYAEKNKVLQEKNEELEAKELAISRYEEMKKGKESKVESSRIANILGLREENESLKKNNEELCTQNRELQEQCDILQLDNALMKKEKERTLNYNEEIETLKKNNEELRKVINNRDKEIRVLKRVSEKVCTQNRDLTKQVDKLLVDNALLKEDNNLSESCDKLQAEVKRLKELIKTKDRGLKDTITWELRRKELKETVEICFRESKTWKKNNEEVRKVIEELNEELEMVGKANKELAEESEMLEESNDLLRLKVEERLTLLENRVKAAVQV